MEKTIITSGKTIDLAIEAALEQLGMDRDSVSVQVLQQAKAGFLGIGAQPAKVQVTYEAPDPVPEAPKVALSSASRSKPKAPAKKPEPKPEAPKPEAPKPQPKPEEAKPERKPEAPRAERKPERKPETPKAPREPKPEKKPAAPKTYEPAPAGSTEEKIEQFLKGLLEHMDSKAVPHCWQDSANTYKVDLVGDDLGYLIGRRGETLDAIQQLTSYSVNRTGGRVRVQLDAENYREKREQSLQHLAKKVAGKVVKYRRSVTLEPMNAYERHVIHTALQEVPGVTTYSTGTEPNRRVIVAYDRDKK